MDFFESSPDSAPMHYNLGNALIPKGNRDEALRRLGAPVSE
jgi:hypothetical protein